VTAVVKAESLTKRFGQVPAVTDLSFALEAGTITGCVQVRSGRCQDQLAEIGEVLVAPGEDLRGDQVARRRHWRRQLWQHFEPGGACDYLVLDPRTREQGSMITSEPPCSSRTPDRRSSTRGCTARRAWQLPVGWPACAPRRCARACRSGRR